MGAGLISMAMITYEAAVSQLSPLYNMNVLITVGLGLIVLGEYQGLDVKRLLAGAVLIAIGAILVSGS
jgi:transporter family protein